MHPLYAAALAADETYRRELVRAYGARDASDARYRRSHADATVQAAADRKHAADAAWLAVFELARSPRKGPHKVGSRIAKKPNH